MCGPLTEAARKALLTRNDFMSDGDMELLEFVEVDAVQAVKLLLRNGSPRLRAALAQAFQYATIH